MSIIQVDLVGWLPDSLKREIIDGMVTFVADQAQKALGDEVSHASNGCGRMRLFRTRWTRD